MFKDLHETGCLFGYADVPLLRGAMGAGIAVSAWIPARTARVLELRLPGDFFSVVADAVLC